jgi:hypothetical protein
MSICAVISFIDEVDIDVGEEQKEDEEKQRACGSPAGVGWRPARGVRTIGMRMGEA